MAMTIRQLDKVLVELDRMKERALAAKRVIGKDWDRWREEYGSGSPSIKRDDWSIGVGSPETGAARRASMDLTRELALLRERK